MAQLLLPGGTGAQEPPAAAAVQPPTVPAQDTVGITPGAAFLRALLIPGWGHASIGEHTRGGFYFLAETASAWMMIRTRTRLGAAREVRELQADLVRARLASQGVTDPEEILDAIDDDEAVAAAEDLVEARSQQFEDWLVFGVFMAFLSGADAFVSAHLGDFPDPVGVQLAPSGDGGLAIGGSLRLGLGPRD